MTIIDRVQPCCFNVLRKAPSSSLNKIAVSRVRYCAHPQAESPEWGRSEAESLHAKSFPHGRRVTVCCPRMRPSRRGGVGTCVPRRECPTATASGCETCYGFLGARRDAAHSTRIPPIVILTLLAARGCSKRTRGDPEDLIAAECIEKAWLTND